jgi:hypothetical protein
VPDQHQHHDPHGRPQKVSRSQASQAREQLAAGGLSHQERRQLRGVTRIRDTAARRRRMELRHFIIVAAGTIAAMAIVAGASGLIPAIQAASGGGTAGTFVVGNQGCMPRKGGCAWSGTFQSPGGALIQHVNYDANLPAGAGNGSSIPAIYPGGAAHVVYPPHGSHAWMSDLLEMVLAGAFVGFLLWLSPLGQGGRGPSGHRADGAIV